MSWIVARIGVEHGGISLKVSADLNSERGRVHREPARGYSLSSSRAFLRGCLREGFCRCIVFFASLRGQCSLDGSVFAEPAPAAVGPFVARVSRKAYDAKRRPR